MVMTSAILECECEPRQQGVSPEGLSGDSQKNGFVRSPVGDQTLCDSADDESRRASRVRRMRIEFIASPAFENPRAARDILRPAPAAPTDTGETCGDSRRKAPAGTPPYLAALYATPLLTRDQEFHLFRKMNYLKFSAERLRKRLQSRNPQRAQPNYQRQLKARGFHCENSRR
jgi:hypothetical protein